MIKAVVFDWAGTMVDFGSLAPMVAFVKLFDAHGIRISIDQARIPMGMKKWDHINALLQMPDIAAQWEEKAGHSPRSDDVDVLLDTFTPMSRIAIRQHAALVPGAREIFEALLDRGIRVASTTGYSRELMEVLLPLAAQQGYRPEHVLVPDDVNLARPAPEMMQKIADAFGVSNPREILKVDDTKPGIDEGRNFGAWTAGVVVTGNAMGLSEQQWDALEEKNRRLHHEVAWRKVEQMEPDFVIDSVADVLSVIERIQH